MYVASAIMLVTILANFIDKCGNSVNYSPIFFITINWKIRALSLMYAKNSERN